MPHQKIKKALIPVAGLGTRFLPASKSIPKEMLPIVDKPSIQYIVEEAIQSGIEQIIFITGHGKEAIENHFDTHSELESTLENRNKGALLEEIKKLSEMADIITVRQKKPLGLGHAVLCGKEVIGKEPFAVLLADDLVDAQTPCLRQLIDVYESKAAPVISLMEVPKDQTHLYGIVDVTYDKNNDRTYTINRFIEKPPVGQAPSQLAIIGRYILTPEIFSCLESIPRGKGGEYQLTDALQQLSQQRPVMGYRFQGTRMDAGDKLGFLHANIYFGLKRPEFRDSLKAFIKTLEL